MREIEFYAGENIENTWKTLLRASAECGETCYAMFNDKQLLSTDTLDEAYKKVTGLTKSEFDDECKREREEYKRKKEEHLASIPEKTKEYCAAARGVIVEERYAEWDNIVPIRLKDLYCGMELDATLEICKIMRDESIDIEERFKTAKKAFDNQGHSGMSASLVLSMVSVFCPHGRDLIDKIRN